MSPKIKAVATAIALTFAATSGFASSPALAQATQSQIDSLSTQLASAIDAAVVGTTDDNRQSAVQSAVNAFFAGKGLSQADEQSVFAVAITKLSPATRALPGMTTASTGQQTILASVGNNLPASTTSTDIGNGTGSAGGGGSTNLVTPISGGSGSSV